MKRPKIAKRFCSLGHHRRCHHWIRLSFSIVLINPPYRIALGALFTHFCFMVFGLGQILLFISHPFLYQFNTCFMRAKRPMNEFTIWSKRLHILGKTVCQRFIRFSGGQRQLCALVGTSTGKQPDNAMYIAQIDRGQRQPDTRNHRNPRFISFFSAFSTRMSLCRAMFVCVLAARNAFEFIHRIWITKLFFSIC